MAVAIPNNGYPLATELYQLDCISPVNTTDKNRVVTRHHQDDILVVDVQTITLMAALYCMLALE